MRAAAVRRRLRDAILAPIMRLKPFSLGVSLFIAIPCFAQTTDQPRCGAIELTHTVPISLSKVLVAPIALEQLAGVVNAVSEECDALKYKSIAQPPLAAGLGDLCQLHCHSQGETCHVQSIRLIGWDACPELAGLDGTYTMGPRECTFRSPHQEVIARLSGPLRNADGGDSSQFVFEFTMNRWVDVLCGCGEGRPEEIYFY